MERVARTFAQRISRVAVAAVSASALLLVAGCGGSAVSESKSSSEPPATVPDHLLSGPMPTAEELCGTETVWPDSIRFVTPRSVVRRFKVKTGVTLERERSLDFPGARTFFKGPRAWGLPGAPTYRTPASERLFGDFSLSVIDPKCPALIEWLGADDEPGPGGLVWSHEIVSEGTCWTGEKRYPHSNLVVGWYATGKHACGHLVDSRWRRLNRVLTEITRAG